VELLSCFLCGRSIRLNLLLSFADIGTFVTFWNVPPKQLLSCEIPGSHGGEYEVYRVLG
jgi:hypothetical protein